MRDAMGRDMVATEPTTTRRAPDRAKLLASIVAVVLANNLDMVIPPAGIPVALLLVWASLRWTGWNWRDIGLRRPVSWLRTVALGIAVATAWTAAYALVLGPGIDAVFGAEPDLSRFDAMRGNIGMLALYLTVSWTTAGFGEEVIWRGLALTGLASIFGGTRGAWGASLAIVTVSFGVLHLYQGPAGMVATGLAGLVLAAVYMKTGNLWASVITHGAMNTIGFVALFLGLDL